MSKLNCFIGRHHVAPNVYKEHDRVVSELKAQMFTVEEAEIIYDEVRLSLRSMEDDGGYEPELIERYESVLRKL